MLGVDYNAVVIDGSEVRARGGCDLPMIKLWGKK